MDKNKKTYNRRDLEEMSEQSKIGFPPRIKNCFDCKNKAFRNTHDKTTGKYRKTWICEYLMSHNVSQNRRVVIAPEVPDVGILDKCDYLPMTMKDARSAYELMGFEETK